MGIDAPVWLASSRVSVPARDGARVLVVPPDFEHATGAVGWSVAIFVEPGARNTPFRGDERPFVVEGEIARRAVAACRESLVDSRPEVRSLVEEVVRLSVRPSTQRLDPRVARALDQLARSPETKLPDLAGSLGLSLDRMTHLFSVQTGIPPRTHALWNRLLRVLSAAPPAGNLAAAAAAAGFSDHAHMTRTFRRFLGRAPSEFQRPPRVVAPWAEELPRT